MKRYVLGLLFTKDKKSVVLIRKRKKDWQYGCLNGIGGLIEDMEASCFAMVREFHEETGVLTNHEDWISFGHMEGKEWMVILYKMYNDEIIQQVRAQLPRVIEEGEIELAPTNSDCLYARRPVDNLVNIVSIANMDDVEHFRLIYK